jgi:type I restriction enzyme S subunit
MNMRFPLVKLGSVLRRVARFEKRDDLLEYRFAGTYSFGRGIFVGEKKTGSSFQLDKIQRIRTGDFVYCKIMAWEGAFGLVPEQCNGCVMSGAFVVYEVDTEKIDPNFLDYYFKIKSNWEAIGSQSTGTNVRRRSLHPNQFEAATIPNPPLSEQRRIVARIEELAARIEEARELRRRAVEETSALLLSSKGILFSEVFNKNWPVLELGKFAEIRAGVTLGRRLSCSAIRMPYLRVANVQDGYLDLSLIKEIEILESEREKWQLQDGDILLTEGGDWDKLGRSVVWHNEIQDCIHQNHIFRLRVDPNEFDPEYLCALIGSNYGKKYFQKASKQTTNLASINQRQLKAFEAFKPPISEQRRIVAYLNGMQSKLDALKRHQAQTAAELDALLPAVLERAFRGEL